MQKYNGIYGANSNRNTQIIFKCLTIINFAFQASMNAVLIHAKMEVLAMIFLTNIVVAVSLVTLETTVKQASEK